MTWDWGKDSEKHSSGSIYGKVLWRPDPRKWGTAVTTVPGGRSHHSNISRPREEMQWWDLQGAPSAGISNSEVHGSSQYQRMQTSTVVTLAGVLLLSFSPWDEIPLRGPLLELSCFWPGDRLTHVKCFLCFFYVAILNIWAQQNFFSFFIVVQKFLWAILVVYLLFCCFWWRESVRSSYPSILQMSLPLPHIFSKLCFYIHKHFGSYSFWGDNILLSLCNISLCPW